MHVHFIGIGGISMSALAKFLLKNGILVSGSDKAVNDNVFELLKLGIKIDNSLNQIKNADLVVINSAISGDDAQLTFAKANNIRVITRSKLLSEISEKFSYSIGVSGSHGKTTATSLIAHILDSDGKNFTAHIGGIDLDYGNLTCKGKDYFLTEVCEYKKNIEQFKPDLGVVLNIDNDHLDSYKTIQNLTKSFYSFLDKSKLRVINCENKFLNKYDNDAFTFGLKRGDIYAKNIDYKRDFTDFSIMYNNCEMCRIKTKLLGEYSVYNILAAVSVGYLLGIKIENIVEGINNYKGIYRRNEILGKINGNLIIADYAHHPTEISQALAAYHKRFDNLVTVFQPHTYSRTKILKKDFIKSFEEEKDLLIYKTYAAREDYDYFGSAEFLSKNVVNSKYYDSFKQLYEQICGYNNKTIVILGAGDLYDLTKNKINGE